MPAVISRRHLGPFVLVAFGVAFPAAAQQQAGPQALLVTAAAGAVSTDAEPEGAQSVGANSPPAEEKPPRIFGVLPNYTTVEDGAKARPLTTGQAFEMAALSSFD